jgi:hypothetical protein
VDAQGQEAVGDDLTAKSRTPGSHLLKGCMKMVEPGNWEFNSYFDWVWTLERRLCGKGCHPTPAGKEGLAANQRSPPGTER